MADKQSIINALRIWINQRPGLEYGNYGDVVSYRAEVRQIGRDLTHARQMLAAVTWRNSITADMILQAAHTSRLSIIIDGDKVKLDYTTGQYWPTEYRPAVCRLLASVLWSYWRDCHPHADGDALRATARRELGRAVANRWFA